MSRRAWEYGLCAAFAACLYFFENGAGTRICAACFIISPLIPAIRRALLSRPRRGTEPRERTRPLRAAGLGTEEDLTGVREYRPGDSVSRIHWKLSARRDTLLARYGEEAPAQWEAEAEGLEMNTAPADARGTMIWAFPAFSLLCLVLLAALPGARLGAGAILNRLFDESEKVNAYVYSRFSVPEGQSAALAWVLLCGAAAGLVGWAAASRGPLIAAILYAILAAAQVYLGLALPGWMQVTAFALVALRFFGWPLGKKPCLALAAVTAAAVVAAALIFPGVDEATEAASEAVRDRMSRLTGQEMGEAYELPAGERETRHVHTQSLTEGDGAARAGREYRLVTVEKKMISMPRLIDWVRAACLLLLTAAVVAGPFVPFALVNRRRQRAIRDRKVFEDPSVREAVKAIFQCAAAWLDACALGGENLPYRQWKEGLSESVSPEYAARFERGASLFEEASYSRHEMGEEAREEALALLAETEALMKARSDRKRRLRLMYREWLWI